MATLDEPLAEDRVGAARRPGLDAIWRPERRLLTVGLLLTVTVVASEALSVATILPLVSAELGGLSLYGWTFSAFFLGDLIGIVVAGQAIDRRGLIVPYLAGLLLFGLGLLVGGLTPTMLILVVGRLIQGLGAGAIPTVAYVAIGRAYPDAARPTMFALMSTAWVVPGLLGPGLAGVVATTIGWRWVFLGLLPLLVVAALMTVPSLGDVSAMGEVGDRRAPSRLPAVLVTAAGAALLLAGLDLQSVTGAALVVGGLALGLPAFRRLVPPGTLRARPGVPSTILLRGVQTFGFFGAEAYLPLALISIRHESAAFAGLALTAATLSWTAGSWIQARLVPVWGTRRLLTVGFAFILGGIVLAGTVLAPGVPVAAGVGGWVVAALGMGLSYSVISLIVLRRAPDGQQGALTSSMQLCDVLGTALGAGVGGALVALGVALAWDPALSLAIAFSISATVAFGGLLLARRTD
ncbi:MAG: MFS transporter [Candidatus Limnocylindrales bacterium]